MSSEMPSGAFALVAELRAKPGRAQSLRELTLPLVPKARAEPTTVAFLLHEDSDAPGHLVLYEVYDSKAAHQYHLAQPHVQAWFAQIADLTEGGVKVVHMAFLEP